MMRRFTSVPKPSERVFSYIVRNPLARVRGYADIRFGLAGGHLRMRGIALADAMRIRDAVLSSMGEQDFSEVVEAGSQSA
jgi:putative membrane protein